MMWCPWMFQSLLQAHLLHRVLDRLDLWMFQSLSLLQAHLLHRVLDLNDDWSTKLRRVLLDLDDDWSTKLRRVLLDLDHDWSTKLRRVLLDLDHDFMEHKTEKSVVRQQCGETAVSTMQLLLCAERKRVYVGLPRSQLL